MTQGLLESAGWRRSEDGRGHLAGSPRQPCNLKIPHAEQVMGSGIGGVELRGLLEVLLHDKRLLDGRLRPLKHAHHGDEDGVPLVARVVALVEPQRRLRQVKPLTQQLLLSLLRAGLLGEICQLLAQPRLPPEGRRRAGRRREERIRVGEAALLVQVVRALQHVLEPLAPRVPRLVPHRRPTFRSLGGQALRRDRPPLPTVRRLPRALGRQWRGAVDRPAAAHAAPGRLEAPRARHGGRGGHRLQRRPRPRPSGGHLAFLGVLLGCLVPCRLRHRLPRVATRQHWRVATASPRGGLRPRPCAPRGHRRRPCQCFGLREALRSGRRGEAVCAAREPLEGGGLLLCGDLELTDPPLEHPGVAPAEIHRTSGHDSD
mmetsp:Transcript_18902/g.40166  ORF Transcript_18902/g.40166 Transcript_18902/m.40166 type:complete len:373 (+) Transcript_18902:526-1644(+)